MKSNFIALLALLALAASAQATGTGFPGHWTEKPAAKHCTVVRGFVLRADGAAKVDWATEEHVEQRDGIWRARGGKLHLAVSEVISDPAILKQLGRNAPLTVETDIDGALNAAGELETVVTNTRDHNIDGAPYSANCTYVRR